MTFIKIKPDYLYGGQAALATNVEQDITPTPRSWERISNIMKLTKSREDLNYIVSGIVGESAAAEFFHVVEEVSELPPIEDILKAEGKKLKSMLPSKTSGMYGLSYSIPSFCNKLEHFTGAIRVFQALTEIEDEKPREEIQALAMELLLGRAYSLENHEMLMKLAASPEYRNYRKKAVKLSELYQDFDALQA